jgi:hypothetical protein
MHSLPTSNRRTRCASHQLDPPAAGTLAPIRAVDAPTFMQRQLREEDREVWLTSASSITTLCVDCGVRIALLRGISFSEWVLATYFNEKWQAE